MLWNRQRLSASVSDEARRIMPRLRSYPAFDAFSNPITRQVARANAHKAWSETLGEIDFQYSSTECDFNGVSGTMFRTEMTDPGGPVILFVHAGAFVAGAPMINAAGVLPTAYLSKATVYAVDYDLAPETQFPVALHQIADYFAGVVEAAGDRPVIMMGDSAGANLALSATMDLRDQGRPMPAGLILISGCFDGTASSDTIITMQRFDPLMKNRGDINLGNIFRHYAGEVNVADPRVSPLLRNVDGLPPTLIQVGSREMLLGDSARLSEKLRQAAGTATLRVFDGMFHMFHLHWSMPEARHAHGDIADFIGKLPTA